MTFEDFKNYALEDDARNLFSAEINLPAFVPIYLAEFYQCYNPIDVEISTELGSVRFYPANKLDELQQEYGIVNAFVFATCNSDPIFLSQNQLYTFPHGVKEPVWEPLSLSITRCFLEQQ